MNIYLLIQYIWAVFLAVGPIIGYIPQYIDIKRTRNCQGFSSVICFILLTSNILRILSFLVKPFDVFLLAQSVFMVTVQLLMLHLIVKLSSRGISTSLNAQDNRTFLSAFWAWKSFFEYMIFISIFTLFFTSIVLIDKFLYPSEIIKVGSLYVSTLVESTLCMPQVWINWRNQSTFGLNNSLVLSWISGDIFKLSYFIYSKSEMAFIVCAIIQIFVDLIIISQICYYKWIKPKESKIETTEIGIRSPSSVTPLKAAPSIEFNECK